MNVHVPYQKRRDESVLLQVSGPLWKSSVRLRRTGSLAPTDRPARGGLTRRGDPHAGEWERNRCARGGVKLAETGARGRDK
jgi:hypothetical protein